MSKNINIIEINLPGSRDHFHRPKPEPFPRPLSVSASNASSASAWSPEIRFINKRTQKNKTI